MSLGKVARKLKRVGKSAFQFRFTSTFEFIELSFNGSWRPDNLRVVWLRNHRKVKSTDVQWSPTEDRGPNGADGRAVFSPQISAALIVTLYKEGANVDFQEKEYKYYIENDGPNGKKILASFHCDMADYVGMPNSKHTLSMAFKPVSVKVSKASLGITLESEFIKQGSAVDDDMQSTFSAMSGGTDASAFDDDSEEELEQLSNGPRLSIVEEAAESGPGVPLEGSVKSVLMLGTGEQLKRATLPTEAPPKPSRGASLKYQNNQIENTPPEPDHHSEAQNQQSQEAVSSEDPVIPDSKDPVIPDSKDPVIPDSEDPVIPDSKDPVIPDSKDPVIPNSKDPMISSGEKVEINESAQEEKSKAGNEKPSNSSAGLQDTGHIIAESAIGDDVFAAAQSLAVLRKSSNPPPVKSPVSPAASSSGPSSPAASSSGPGSPGNRVEVVSQDEYRAPANPYLVEEEVEDTPPTLSWVREGASFVDCSGLAIQREKLDRAQIIALYFSASWCPPCRRFLPKLVKFYHHVKQHGKSFEVLYISSDYSKTEMMKYMKEQQMPWVGLAYEGKVAESLQKLFSVSAIPQLKIVSTKGEIIEDSAKKPVEVTNSGADVLRLYNKWYEKLSTLAEDPAPVKSKTRSTKKRGASESDLLDSAPANTGKSRQAISNKSRGRSTLQSKKRASNEERDERIRHLEEINMTLKQTNDDLNEEIRELKAELNELRSKVGEMEQTSRQLEADKQESIAKMNTMGWLYKKGIKGPTANIWRRRFFRCDQGPKICYYKKQGEGSPQGYIDLAKFISVQEVSPAQQDKNNATFLVQCDGRTFQLQAYDESSMRKWMAAIEFLANWHKSNNLNSGATP